jgi:hypothetical protein
MNEVASAPVPTGTSGKTPSKPKETKAPLGLLIEHYNRQLPAYQAVVADLNRPDLNDLVMEPIDPANPSVSKFEVIELIRKQNFRLKRFIRHRSIELLQEVVSTTPEGRTVGRSYTDILDILANEFPEGSTTAAALRWYVVHLWSEADDEGLPRPKMPQIRPRSVKQRAEAE